MREEKVKVLLLLGENAVFYHGHPLFSGKEVEEDHQESQQEHKFRHGSGLLEHILRCLSSKLYANLSSGESLRKTRIFPGEKNPLPVLASLSSRHAERNHARCAAEGFLMDSPSL
jgi:hypothetical protein